MRCVEQRLRELEACERISRVSDMKLVDISTETGAMKTTTYAFSLNDAHQQCIIHLTSRSRSRRIIFMLYSISKNDKVDNIFISHLNTILNLLQQVEDYLNCDDESVFAHYGITKKDVAALVTNIKIELDILYERYTKLGYTDLNIACHFKTCYEKLYLVA